MTVPNIRLYLDVSLHEHALITINKAQSHYLMHVMRCALGAHIRVFHQDTGEWDATFVDLVKGCVHLQVNHCVRAPQSTPYTCHLACPPLRQNRLDKLIEQACALGITRFTPLLTDHTQVRHVSQERLHKIAVESAEQSERLTVPCIDAPQTLDAFLRMYKEDTLHVAWERYNQAMPLWQAVQVPDTIIWMIGPEGGWSAHEQQCFLAHPRVRPVNLGSTILRSETAASVALSVWMSWHQNRLFSSE